VEDVAREHFNMIKENEVIYRFGEEKQRSNDTESLPIKARNGDNIGKPEREDLNDEAVK